MLTHNLDNVVHAFPWEEVQYIDFWTNNGATYDLQVGAEYNVDAILSMHKAQRVSPSAVTGPASILHPTATVD